MAGGPPVAVWCLMRSKATRRELLSPPLSADRNHVRASNEGDGTRWLLEPDPLGYRIRPQEEYPRLLDTGLSLDGTREDIYTMAPNDVACQRWELIPT
jgi:hypothetical protein